ncbi:hypothetical protein ACOSQ2_030939 [Xanthoceras sorbifolium]
MLGIDKGNKEESWAWRLWNEERAVELIVESLGYSSALSEILRCIHVVCYNPFPQAWRLWNEERAVELIVKSLDYSSASSEILQCIHVGLLCVQQGPEDRPNMSTVALMLGGDGSLPHPKQPGFFTERNLPESELSSSKNQSSSTYEISISLLEPR